MQLHCPYSVHYFIPSAMSQESGGALNSAQPQQESADCLVSADSGVRVRTIYYEYNDCMKF